jgi:predicted aconitase
MRVMLELEALDRALLAGEFGSAAARAMRILVRYGEAVGAGRFIAIESAHIDGCLYHGPASIDFASAFVSLGGRVRVPTTLNVAAVDTVHPQWNRGPAELLPAQQRLSDLHVELGCVATLTCAPYQRIFRPRQGEHIAWAESNAIVFANSVLGARTDRYGDFTDLCAALVGRVPYTGLHCDENRRPSVLIAFPSLETSGLPRDLYFATVGYALGERAKGRVALLTGIPDDTTEDEFKSLGAAAASSGAVALFHALGLTPEARSDPDIMNTALPVEAVEVATLQNVVTKLCRLEEDELLSAMCLGTPHFSFAEFERLAAAVEGLKAAPHVGVFISTSREIAAAVEASPLSPVLVAFGVRLVVDVCTYMAPVVDGDGAIVTNSAKYAHYGPGNLKKRVGLMGMERCIRSAVLGRVAR